MISKRKKLGLALLAVLVIAGITGCNDTLRQFINPVPQPGGDPQALSHAVVLSTNPVGNGSDLHINVSGDSVVGVVNTGPNPVFLGKNANRAFVLNGDNTITSYLALLPGSTTPSTITQPAAVTGAIGGGFSSVGNFYVANSGSNNTSVVGTTVSAVVGTLPTGTQPVAVVGNAANSKLYLVNHGSNSVTPISTTDNTVLNPIPVGTQPVWGVMSSDGAHVFIVNQGDGTVSVIDTLLDVVIATVPVGASPNYAVYESNLQRVYVSNTGSNTISVIKANNTDLANGIVPVNLANVPVSGTPTSIAALSDGSRAYAALGNCPAGTNHTTIVATVVAGGCTGNSVSVIDALALKEKKVIQIGNAGSGTVSIDAANDASRVYVVASNDRSVSIIKTAGDVVTATFPAPQQNLSCFDPTSCPANVAQIPFMVRIFP